MHCFIGLLLLLFCSTSLFGQINKGRKFLAAANYEAALQAFENDVEKTANKPISLYEIARIYAQKKFEEYDIDKAYQFATRALVEFEALSSANKRRVQQKGINLPELTKLQQDLVRRALQQYQQDNTIEGLQHFIVTYTSANKHQLEQAYQQRNKRLVEEAERVHTFAQYKTIWETYKKNMVRYNPKEIQLIEQRLLESYIAENSWSMYPRFEELYPENVYVIDRDAAYDYLKIRRSSKLKDYQEFVDAYPKSPFVKFAKDQLAQLTMEGTNLPDYDTFVRAYPNHGSIKELWLRFYELYTQDQQQNSILAFAAAYPSFPFPNKIKEDLAKIQTNLEKPLYEQIIQTQDIYLAMNFVQRFPKSVYISALEESFYKGLKNKVLLRGAHYFLGRYPNSPYYDEVLELYYKEYVKDGELGTLNQFMMEHPEYKNLAQQERDLKIAEQGDQLDLSKMPTNSNRAAYEAYILAAAPKERAFVALQRLIEPSIRQRKWSNAQQIISQFEPAFGADAVKIQQLKLLLTAPAYRSEALPASINSNQTERPIQLQGNQLLFARDGAFYQTTYQGSEWSSPILLPALNEGIQGEYWSARKDGKELVYSQAGELYYRRIEEGRWSTPIKFPEDINRPDREMDVQLNATGNVLLYSSESDQVLDWKTAVVSKNFHGTERSNSDLFVVLKDDQGRWQKAINLGDQLNTPFAERHPFLHPDGKTLYFSSEGHGGLGGLDLYYTRRLDDTWTRWSLPVNLGTLVNSADSEGPCAVSSDYQTIYFSRENDEGTTIFKSPLMVKP